jgi:hypothetical protein
MRWKQTKKPIDSRYQINLNVAEMARQNGVQTGCQESKMLQRNIA